MTQKDYELRLQGQILSLPPSRREEILLDIRSHFHEGMQSGIEEEALAEGLGPPEVLAKEYKALYAAERARENPSGRNIYKAILAGIGMGMLNLIFVLPIAIAVFATWFSLFVSGAAMVVTGVITAIASIIQSIRPIAAFYIPYPLPSFFLSLATAALGGLLIVGMIALGRRLGKWVVRYIEANLDIVMERRKPHETQP